MRWGYISQANAHNSKSWLYVKACGVIIILVKNYKSHTQLQLDMILPAHCYFDLLWTYNNVTYAYIQIL